MPTPSINRQRLAGKRALVTGIGSGIGQGCALMLARQGACVLGCDINAEAAEATIAQARSEGLDITSLHPCDLTQPADVQRWLARNEVQADGVQILVNAAAWCAMAPIEVMDFEAHWRRTLTYELDLVFLVCQAAWPHMKRQGASIINFASANAHQVLKGSPALAHCAGKGGILAMTRQLAMEGAPHGIRANTISPGLVETGGSKGHLELPGVRAAVTAQHMLGRLGTPDDIAWSVSYLASDEASWVTAADFMIDGGATKW